MNLVTGLIVIFFGLNYLGVLKCNLFRGSGRQVSTDNMGFFSAALFLDAQDYGVTDAIGAINAETLQRGIDILLTE